MGAGLQANDGTFNNVEILQNFTLRQHAVMEGSLTLRHPLGGTSVGSAITPEAALKIETLYNSTTPQFVGEIIPGHMETQTTWVDIWGNIDTTQWVETWGWVTRDVQVPVYGDVPTTEYYDATYDENGVELSPAGSYQTTTYGITGYNTEYQQFWEVTGGEYQTTSSNYGVIGSEAQSTEVWVPEQQIGEMQTVYGAPEIRQSAEASETVWTWKNSGYPLMTLGNGGLTTWGALSLQTPGEAAGTRVANLTPTALELIKPATAQQREYGSRFKDSGLTQWVDKSDSETPGITNTSTTDLNPGELRLKSQQSNGSNTVVASRETRVAAESSFFSGTVIMDGTLLVAPQGGLDMGPYTSGNKPPSVEQSTTGGQ